MNVLRSLIDGIKALLHRGQRNGELDEELRGYIEAAAEEKVRRGMSYRDAISAARAEVGNVETVKHKVWATGWESAAESLWRDIAYTIRRLIRSPGLVFAVVVSIGLGIAANATIFSIVSKFVLSPAPVGDPKTLTTIYMVHDGDQCCNNLSYPIFEDIREQAKSFTGVSAYFELVSASISGGSDPERVWGQAATANYFDVAQLNMPLGRGFTSTEEKAPVIVLGYRLWQRRFGGDPTIAGKTISFSGHVYTVTGVAPKGFRGLDQILDPQFWVPLGKLPELMANSPKPESRDSHWLRAGARLKPDVTEAQAIAELHIVAQRFAQTHSATDKGIDFHLEPAGSLPPRDGKAIKLFLAALSVVVLLVLCIACANVANLLLARGAQRQREMAIRLAMGGTRAQLLRQMLFESVVLAIGGGVAGVLLSLWATYALSSFRLPVPIPVDLGVSVDWRVLLYTFVLSITAGIVCGFIPAWRGSRPLMPNALKGEDALARPGHRWTLRNVLVVAQITLSLVLLCAAGLFFRSLQSAAKIETGFRSRGLVMLSIDPQVHGYTPIRIVQLLNAIRSRVLALPGVSIAATTDGLPLSGGNRSDGLAAVGEPKPIGENMVELYMASSGYFETLGIPRVAGRDFGDENPTAPKVAIVNEELVRRFYQGKNPIGKTIRDGEVHYEIIGVVKDTKSRTIGEEQRPVLYRSINQSIAGDPPFAGYSIMARFDGDSSTLVAAMRREIQALDPTLAIFNMQTMEEHLRDALFLPRFVSTLFGIFGTVGVLLASVGLYGVMNYAVSRRTQEIGIRMALGAERGAVQRLIVRDGMRLAILSVVLGVPAALALAKLSTSILYGTRPYDLVTFLTVPLLLLAVALLACWIPSRRASRVDPIQALRMDG